MEGDFRIGRYLVRPRLNAVECEGLTTHLEPKVMQVLVGLAAHPGEVIARQQLREMVWQDVFVGDDVLVRAISELRRVFQDDPRSHHTIQTVPKVGYRLVQPVEAVEAGGPVDPLPPATCVVENEPPVLPVPSPAGKGGMASENGVLPDAQQSLSSPAWKSARPIWGWVRMPLWGLGIALIALLILVARSRWNLRPSNAAAAAGEAPAIDALSPVASLKQCPLIAGATYLIENKKSGSALEVPIYSASNGTLLDQWKPNGGANQRWVVQANGPYWTFVNAASRKMLDDPRGSRAPSIQMDQWEANGAPNQNWLVIPVGDKSCKIISQTSGLLLDVKYAWTTDGTPVIQYTDNDGMNQHWLFRLVAKPEAAPAH